MNFCLLSLNRQPFSCATPVYALSRGFVLQRVVLSERTASSTFRAWASQTPHVEVPALIGPPVAHEILLCHQRVKTYQWGHLRHPLMRHLNLYRWRYMMETAWTRRRGLLVTPILHRFPPTSAWDSAAKGILRNCRLSKIFVMARTPVSCSRTHGEQGLSGRILPGLCEY